MPAHDALVIAPENQASFEHWNAAVSLRWVTEQTRLPMTTSAAFS